ncbi:transmembrane protein, putative (macronuclear) [Tetrahymena thermophila SB210]|uniref:Transmembrane protein, putative n=1 Tax=Tetrahymena thermophila (strain SB210) TaxID=312017 RepID=W7XIC8_TETTS|nr:transmembrane protein, putative [Tetrahymena thermophila SB210]EWS73189.1 transmembrane protein, putative [Tetrahymena thermophila SB210]|eukprot:XP_012654265.1 transmembrane protein, putative [Tetrahymena thermophila SB210]
MSVVFLIVVYLLTPCLVFFVFLRYYWLVEVSQKSFFSWFQGLFNFYVFLLRM